MNIKISAMIIGSLLVTGLGARESRPDTIEKNKPEEVVVKAKDLSNKDLKDKGIIPVGINSEVLIHVYDKKTDTWKYVEKS